MKNQNLEFEKDLLFKAKENKSSFDQLYKYFLNDVYRFSYSLVNNKENAEDITSKVFIQFYQKIDSFEWNNISLKSWLFQTARNFAYEKFREPMHQDLDENFHFNQEYEITFVDEIMNKDLLEKVKKEIQELKPIEQEVINLRIWEGMQFSEIANLQGSSEDTAKKRFYRSIEKLKKSLEDKKIRNIVALPFLFTAIAQVGLSPAYAAPATFSSIGFSTFIVSQKTTMPAFITAIKTIFTTKAGLGLAAAAVVTTSALGGGIYYANSKNNDVNQDNKVSITTPIPTSTPTSISTPEPTSTPTMVTSTSTPTPTSTLPDAYLNWKTYTDTRIGISFRYPEKFKNIEAKTYELGKTKYPMLTITSTPSNPTTELPVTIFLDGIKNVNSNSQEFIDYITRSGGNTNKLGFTEFVIENKSYKVSETSYGDGSGSCNNFDGFSYAYAIVNNVVAPTVASHEITTCNSLGKPYTRKTSKEDLLIGKKIVESITFINQPQITTQTTTKVQQNLIFTPYNSNLGSKSEITLTSDSNIKIEKINSTYVAPNNYKDGFEAFYQYRVYDSTNPNLFNLVFAYPYESFDTSLQKSVSLPATSFSKILNRVQKQNNTWFYSSSNIKTTGECPYPGQFIKAPCGSPTLYTQKNGQPESLYFIRCDASSDVGLKKCDELITTMTTKKY